MFYLGPLLMGKMQGDRSMLTCQVEVTFCFPLLLNGHYCCQVEVGDGKLNQVEVESGGWNPERRYSSECFEAYFTHPVEKRQIDSAFRAVLGDSCELPREISKPAFGFGPQADCQM